MLPWSLLLSASIGRLYCIFLLHTEKTDEEEEGAVLVDGEIQ